MFISPHLPTDLLLNILEIPLFFYRYADLSVSVSPDYHKKLRIGVGQETGRQIQPQVSAFWFLIEIVAISYRIRHAFEWTLAIFCALTTALRLAFYPISQVYLDSESIFTFTLLHPQKVPHWKTSQLLLIVQLKYSHRKASACVGIRCYFYSMPFCLTSLVAPGVATVEDGASN